VGGEGEREPICHIGGTPGEVLELKVTTGGTA